MNYYETISMFEYLEGSVWLCRAARFLEERDAVVITQDLTQGIEK